MISPEVKKFLAFRNELITLLDNSFSVMQDDYDSCYLEGDSTKVADKIISLIEKFDNDKYHEVIVEDERP
ncbi:MAG: hypothetical protein K0S93_33 [Nitrososphaeraceae archaeon]|nr:hypothetical protein [Nitrososphaeraceae archaeon]